jgi:hypothetical protein
LHLRLVLDKVQVQIGKPGDSGHGGRSIWQGGGLRR